MYFTLIPKRSSKAVGMALLTSGFGGPATVTSPSSWAAEISVAQSDSTPPHCCAMSAAAAAPLPESPVDDESLPPQPARTAASPRTTAFVRAGRPHDRRYRFDSLTSFLIS